MNRWFYTQPGEKLTFSIPRSIFPMRCGGCHGALTGNRADALGPPDIVSASSRVMANWDHQRQQKRSAFGRGKDYSDYFSIDFRRDIQPILKKRCVSCHGDSGQKAAGLDLRGIPTERYTIAYESLHILEDPESGNFANKRYINEREGMAIESYLMEKLMGRELDAPQKLLKPGLPHPSEIPLNEEELLTIIRWIDLGATFLGGKSI
jgi:mono/diheme cytochrome c family protein